MKWIALAALALGLAAAPAMAQSNGSVTGCLVREIWSPGASLRFSILDAAGQSHAFALDRAGVIAINGANAPPTLTSAQFARWTPLIASFERAAATQRKFSIDIANNRAFGIAIDWSSACS
jgi:hypothetical protein